MINHSITLALRSFRYFWLHLTESVKLTAASLQIPFFFPEVAKLICIISQFHRIGNALFPDTIKSGANIKLYRIFFQFILQDTDIW